jgi:hypothetical protein
MYKKIIKHFEEVKEFIGLSFPRFRNFKLYIGCPYIEERRQLEDWFERQRAYMHTNCMKNTICVHPLAEKLSSAHLYGLFLHEFGHHLWGSKAGEFGQANADLSILTAFGIPIYYNKKREIQFIEQKSINLIRRTIYE